MDSRTTTHAINQPKKHRSLAKILVLGVGLPMLFVAYCAIAGMMNVGTLQWFMDKFRAANYNASPEISAMVEKSGMNSRGEFYFYAGEPSLDSAEQFNINCAELLNEESNVLGCYDGKIYLFDVTDERIKGVKNVSAAHEMLHVAYDRLGILDKIYVDGLIEQELARTNDSNILGLVELYANLEPGQEINELHSIFGTESADLSAELEEYYTRYFGDRSKVVTENKSYTAVFEELEAQAEETQAKMLNLESEINTLQNQYLLDKNQLAIDIDKFNEKANIANSFASEAVFYAERSRLLARQNALADQVEVMNTKIDEYNSYVEDLQALGKDVEALSNNLNSQSEIIE